MSYPNGTILVRDNPKQDRNDPKKESPFNRVKVIGNSPIKTTAAGEWEGGQGESLIVEPLTSFSATEILPVEVAHSEYSIEYEPDPEATHLVQPEPAKAKRLLTAEEQFRIAAKEAEKEKK